MARLLGAHIEGPDDDFFELGGGSLSAAQLVTALRERYPEMTVAELYDHPRLGSLAVYLDELAPTATAAPREVAPVSRWAQFLQLAATVPLTTLTGLQWVTWLAILNNVIALVTDVPWTATLSWWWVAVGFVVFLTPLGRMSIAVLGARILLRGLTPGSYPRGGSIHLRLWIAQRLSEATGATNLSGAPWMRQYARALGAKIGHGVDLHTLPPVTGMLELGDGCSIEPEVDLSGHWVDGDIVHVGSIRIGAGASIGARSFLAPVHASARTPRSRPAPRCSAGSRRVSTGPVHPRRRRARPNPSGRPRTHPAEPVGFPSSA